MTIGEKIRARRKSLGMTQKEVAGTAVTRNMICAIERGDVSPSLSTLSVIADALGIPPAYLVSDEDELAVFLAGDALPRIRAAFSAERYADVSTMVRRLPEEARQNEVAALYASALVSLAERALISGDLSAIPSLLDEAERYAARSPLPSSHLLARAALCRGVAKSPETPKWSIDAELYCSMVNEAVNLELYRYLSESDYFPVFDKHLHAHLEAKEKIAARRYSEALTILSEIEEHKASGELGSYLLYRIYTDTELCYKEIGDYENAYRYSTKRISLLSSFRG